MKLLIVLLSLLIGVQSETLEEVNKQIEALTDELEKAQNEQNHLNYLINTEKTITSQIEESIFAARNESADFENNIKNISQKLTSCRTALSACLEDDKKTKLSEKRLDEVKQEEERHRSELKALEDEQKNHPAELEDLNLQSNATRNNSKLLEAELQELRLKLSECPKEPKNHKEINQSTVKEKTDGGGFINKIVISTLNNVKQLKKGVANALRSKINLLKFNIPE